MSTPKLVVPPQAELSESPAAERDPLLESFRQATIIGQGAGTGNAKPQPSNEASTLDIAAAIAAGLVPPDH